MHLDICVYASEFSSVSLVVPHLLEYGRSIAHYDVLMNRFVGGLLFRFVSFFFLNFVLCEMPQVTALLCIHYRMKKNPYFVVGFI